jgi:transposase
MRLSISKTKNSENWYIVKDFYLGGKNTTHIMKKLGTKAEIEKYHKNPLAWAKDLAKQMTLDEKKNTETEPIQLSFSPRQLLPLNSQNQFFIGYLFLQKIYSLLQLKPFAQKIAKDAGVTYDFNDILAHLLYTRILAPGSKKNTFEQSQKFLESTHFEQHQIYRALDLLAKNAEALQEKVYETSKKLVKRNDKILYYDCTNFFFEIEQEAGLKQYGASKEHRPNPIVQMGLFMDGSGFPLSFSMTPGNQNEQTTLTPLEKKILKDYPLSDIVVCTDAGLASSANKKFNSRNGRYFITAHSLKKMKATQQESLLDPSGWRLPHSQKVYNLAEIDQDKPTLVYYKESEWLDENGLKQRFVVTFSLKYQAYLRNIRERQIDRALIKTKRPSAYNRKRANDPKRLIKENHLTAEGEIAEQLTLDLDLGTIKKEERFDGFYCLSTNLEASAEELIAVNSRRWEIEESFRMMKSEMKARPVYLRRDERIKAHFLTCFLSLLMVRILEAKLDQKFSVHRLIQTLKEMSLINEKNKGYRPCYTRNELTDALHEVFGFRTDWEVITQKEMKKILQESKKLR